MNKAYKVVYSKARQKFVVASELVHACADRQHSSRFVSVSALMAALGTVILSVSGPVVAKTYTSTVGTDGTVTIAVGDIDGDGEPDIIEIGGGIGLSVVEGTYPEGDSLAGRKYYSLKSFGASADLGAYSNAIGWSAGASGQSSNAIGHHAKASGEYSNAIGYSAKASGEDSNAIGRFAEASDEDSNAIGYLAKASGDSSNAIGPAAKASGNSSNAIGWSAEASGHSSNAIGWSAEASGEYSNAIGFSAKASFNNATALGAHAVADEPDTVSVGRAAKAATETESAVTGIKRRIVNVADGTKSSDAATVGQLPSVSLASGQEYLTLTHADGSTDYQLALATSDDVYGSTTGLVTNAAVKSALDALSTATATGSDYLSVNATDSTVSAPSTSAQATGAHSLALGEGAIASGVNSIAIGWGSVASAVDTFSVGSTSKQRRITNVAAGTSATDAATVAQLATFELSGAEKPFREQSAQSKNPVVTYAPEIWARYHDTFATLTTGRNANGSTVYKLSLNVSNSVGDFSDIPSATDCGFMDCEQYYDSLATNKGVFFEVRPTADGTYVKTKQTTSQNLKALDDQVSKNSDVLEYLSINSTDETLTVEPSTSAKAMGKHSVALGEEAKAAGGAAMAVGKNASASGDRANALGLNATASAQYSLALGVEAKATAEADFSTAIGDQASVEGKHAIVIGHYADATKLRSIAIGDKASAIAEGATALGAYAVADEANTVSVGRAANGTTVDGEVKAFTRRIVNVADGTKSSDAATVGQLPSVSLASEQKYLTLTHADGSTDYKLALATSDDVYGSTTGLVTNAAVKSALDALSTATAAGSDYLSVNATDSTVSAPSTSAKATGAHSLALGEGASTAGDKSNAIGLEASASGVQSNAIGQEAQATAWNANAIGTSAVASGTESNAIGFDAKAQGDSANAIGLRATAAQNSNAIGQEAKAEGKYATAIGREAQASKDYNNALGDHAIASGERSTALGRYATALGNSATAIGRRAKAAGESSNAIGNYATATAENAFALGTDSVADVANTISVGRTASAVSENTAKNGTVITRRIVNVAAGKDPTDAATVAQLPSVSLASGQQYLTLTHADDSTDYKLALATSDDVYGSATGLVTNVAVKTALEGYAKANGDNVTDAAAWAGKIGTGTVASDSATLITGQKVYSEVRPTEDGAYVQTAKTTGENLKALDTQVKANATEITNLTNLSNITDNGKSVIRGEAIGAVTLAAGENTTVTSEATGSGAGQVKTYKVKVTTDGRVEAENTGIVTGGTVKKAIDDLKSATATDLASYAKADGSNVASESAATWAGKIGTGTVAADSTTLITGQKVYSEVRPTADGTYVKTSKTTGENLKALDTQVKANVGNITANAAEITKLTNLSNITDSGKSVIRGEAIGAVTLAAGENTTVTSEATGSGAGQVKTYKVKVTTDGQVEAENTGIVTGGTVKKAIDDLKSATATDLANYAKADGSNVASESAATWAGKIGTGTVAADSTTLITGQKVYSEVRPTADGTYVKTSKTTGENLKALDTQVKANVGNITANAAEITKLTNLSNITDSGKSVIRGEAIGAVTLAAGENTTVTSEATGSGAGQVKTYKVKVTTDGQVEAENTGIVTGGTVKKAIDDLKSATATDLANYAKADGSNVTAESAATWAGKIGTGTVASNSATLITGQKVYSEVRPTADGTYVRTAKTTGENLKALDTQVNTNATRIAANATEITNLTNLSNITDDGKSVIRGEAIGAVTLAAGENTTVTSEATGSGAGQVKTYKVKVTTDGRVEAENTGIVTGGTVAAALKTLKSETTGAITSIEQNYAMLNGSNLSAENARGWASVLSNGAVIGSTDTAGSNLLITGAALYDEVRPVRVTRDGEGFHYIATDSATGENLIALDSKLFDLSETIKTYNGKIEYVKSKAEEAAADAATAKSDASEAKSNANTALEKAGSAEAKADEAKTEAGKHTTLVDSDHIKVTESANEAGGKQYSLSIAETADFTAKQTTWKDGDAASTANGSGFFSGGASAENADAYVSKGVVSAGKEAEKKIVLDGNTGKATFGKTVTIDGSTGRISGLAAGDVSEDSTDAVNGAQLYETQQMASRNAESIQALGSQVNKVDRKINRTGALAAALAALHPQDYDESHPVTGAAGVGHYKGKQALAVGMYVRPAENLMFSLGASASGDSDYMLNAGVSYRFGGPSLQKSPVQMAARISEQEVTIRDLAAQNQVQKTLLESQKSTLDAQKVRLDAQASEIEKLKAMMAEIKAQLAK